MKATRLPALPMIVEKVVAPPLDNNAYLLIDEPSKQAAVSEAIRHRTWRPIAHENELPFPSN